MFDGIPPRHQLDLWSLLAPTDVPIDKPEALFCDPTKVQLFVHRYRCRRRMLEMVFEGTLNKRFGRIDRNPIRRSDLLRDNFPIYFFLISARLSVLAVTAQARIRQRKTCLANGADSSVSESPTITK